MTNRETSQLSAQIFLCNFYNLESVITEYLNILLHQLARSYHAAVSKVDLTEYIEAGKYYIISLSLRSKLIKWVPCPTVCYFTETSLKVSRRFELNSEGCFMAEMFSCDVLFT